MYLSAWLQTLLQLWLSVRFTSFVAPLGIAFAAIGVGIVLVRSETYGRFFPWLLPIDALSFGGKYAYAGVLCSLLGSLIMALTLLSDSFWNIES